MHPAPLTFVGGPNEVGQDVHKQMHGLHALLLPDFAERMI